jgi:hypothetical protein
VILFPKLGWACYDAQNNDRGAMSDTSQLEAKLQELTTEHRDLDEAIAALSDDSRSDTLQVKRLKKRKLAIRDQIAAIEGQLQPAI